MTERNVQEQDPQGQDEDQRLADLDDLEALGVTLRPPISDEVGDLEQIEQAAEASHQRPDHERQVVTYAQLGIFTQRPKHADMATEVARLNTFGSWPFIRNREPVNLASAGFYYAGYSDCVRCFYCGGELKGWKPSDDPWIEHARWFPRCPYVGLCKGQEFMNSVQRLHTAGQLGEITREDVTEQMNRNRRPPQGQEPEDRALPQQMCKICQLREVKVVFLPCGHLVACGQCAVTMATCTVCKTRVKGRVRSADG